MRIETLRTETTYNLGGQLLGLARGGAVADDEERDPVAVNHVLQGVNGFGPFFLRLVRVDGAGIEQFAGRVDDGDFGAGAEAGVEAQHGLVGERRQREQSAQVGGKDVDGVAVGGFGQGAAHVALDGGQQQAFGGVFDCQGQLVAERGEDVFLEFGFDGGAPVALVDVDAQFENFFLFAAVEGQDLVRLQAADDA